MSPQSLLVKQAKLLLSKAQPPVKSKLNTVWCSSQAVAVSAGMLCLCTCSVILLMLSGRFSPLCGRAHSVFWLMLSSVMLPVLVCVC